MKKLTIFLILCMSCSALSVAASDVFSHKVTAQTAASQMPEFESKTCKFNQSKYMTTSTVTLKSSGNFKFIKNQGVTFETTYPIHSENSYLASHNKNINAIVKSVVNKNYTYVEKNFDIYFMKTSSDCWILALRPKENSPLKGDMRSLQIAGQTIGKDGLIQKMVIETINATTTINFSQCG